MKNVNDFILFDRRVFLRCDLNVPIDNGGNILDDFKIKRSCDTIRFLLSKRAKVVLATHLGEPDGKFNSKLKLEKIAKKLEKYIDVPIFLANDCVGKEIDKYINLMDGRSVLMLENLKFYKEEYSGDIDFAQKLSWMCEIYVNDDFADCCESYTSICGVPQFLDSSVGLLFNSELSNLNKIIESPQEPFVVIIGGSLSEEKLIFIDKIAKSSDCILTTGLIKEELIKKELFFKNQDKIICPIGFSDNFDIDKKTLEIFKEKIEKAKTIFWSGPLGKIENKKYSFGTNFIAKEVNKSNSFSLVCGEDTSKFLIDNNLDKDISYIMPHKKSVFKYLSKEDIPGLIALSKRI